TLHVLFRKIWEEEQIPPTDWKEGYLIKISKKGNLTKCDNYRGITLLSVAGKVFNRVLLDRLKHSIDAQLQDQQVGFRKDRSCLGQILTLQIIVEQSVEWDPSIYKSSSLTIRNRLTAWIGEPYGNVFDTMKSVSITHNLYDGLLYKVVHGEWSTDSFQVRTRVRQSCLLFPALFLLVVVSWIMNTSTSERKHGIQ
ncbi:unnamed protein product, partial [Schistosoma curassoni]|uniref:Reverse transcriptase domain-containing protein n=1 Tax=Schistosoma curassoni TaxID=6186 RepID=A0A183K3K1_9TREM